MRRNSVAIGLVLGLFCVSSLSSAPPKPKAAQSLPSVDADKLPPGQFAGTLVNPPNSDRMFTLKITYPEVHLKPGAKMPNLRNTHAQNIHRQYQQMMHLQQQMARSAYHHHAVHNMMQMQQTYMQMQMNQQRAAQMMARIQQQEAQQELRLLQQEIKAIQSMYQVVQATRNVDFQAGKDVKVRIKDLPEQFDEKGSLKKYSPAELAALKGKDKSLPGYESSVEALKEGQVVVVVLRAHKKPTSGKLTASLAPKGKEDDKEKDTDSSIQHKMQVNVIVILKDSEGRSTPKAAAKKKKK